MNPKIEGIFLSENYRQLFEKFGLEDKIRIPESDKWSDLS
jgi:hypothetical protein